jgi:hypothetical protein
MALGSSRSEVVAVVALEQELYHKCARKLHFVSRSYFEQGFHIIRSCRELLGQISTLDEGPQKDIAIELLRQ